MNNFKSANERLKFFIKNYYERLNVKKLEEMIEQGNGYISNTKSYSFEVINKIVKLLPELNVDWLITGRGLPTVNAVDEKKALSQEKQAGREDVSLHQVNADLQLIQQELRVILEFQVWLAKDTHGIPLKKIYEKIDTLRRDYQDSLQ